MSGLNLGYRTAEQIRERVEEAVGSMRKDLGMLCNELQMQEASYEILLEERNALIAQLKEVIAERDEARRECCNTWEAVMFRPAADVAADKGWDCFAALEETARESYKGGD